MKKSLFTLLTIFMITSAAYAAEVDSIRVAVIDSGIAAGVIGYDRVAPGQNYILPDSSTEDLLGHGTAVASIIVGSEVARLDGLCPEVTLVPLVYATKLENGVQVHGKADVVAQAIYDAIDVYHCDIINISSGSTVGSYRLKEAVEYAEKKGVLVVSCAGNGQETAPHTIYYPGGYDSVICVGAANSDGTIAAFSQQNDTVDLLALGTDLRLASVKGTRIRGEGTSFATAIVTGAAAQIWTEHPELTADEVRSILLKSSRTIDGWQVFDLDAALAWRMEKEELRFSDVAEGAYYYDAVLWAAAQNITGGTGNGTFSPDVSCTRAQMATFLWRAAGSPAPVSNICAFTDVPADAYYAKAVQWAVEQGITGGTSATTFSPDAPCTRGQMATFLCRMACGAPASNVIVFSDVNTTAYYAKSVQWAYEQKITGGTGATTFSPDAPCTRAQMVTFLYHYFVK